MARSIMPEIEEHFAKHGWKPTNLFHRTLYDVEHGWLATYWTHRNDDTVKLFVIDSFSDGCTCDKA